jgi:hypothetical protein
VQAPKLQPSARTALQTVHTEPPAPHAFRLGVMQLLPAQQPLAQFAGVQLLHMPLVQAAPAGHAVQTAPALPQAVFEVPGWQTPAASQQPLGQLVPSQTQVPAEQWRLPPQGGPPPQEQAPATQESVVTGLHCVQETPMAPQAAAVGVMQRLPLQQPFGQLVASQTQRPTQRWPAWQGNPLPQPQAPPRQLSASSGSQGAQAPAATPHALVVGGLKHTAPWQQPAGQELMLQTLVTHAWLVHDSVVLQTLQRAPPEPQAAIAVPGWQAPLTSQQPMGQVAALQLPARHAWPVHTCPGWQATHEAPPVPHAVTRLPGWQTPEASQQPVPQVAALHGALTQVRLEQTWVVPQATQVAPPPPPQAPLVVPAWHWPAASQQPFGQLTASQAAPAHAWLTHVCAPPHATHGPPPPPHAPLAVPVWHCPLASQQPFGQLVASQEHVPAVHRWPVVHGSSPLPHEQPPLLQPSASSGSHALQAEPLAPHAAAVAGAWHTPRPSQQPPGQVAAVHTTAESGIARSAAPGAVRSGLVPTTARSRGARAKSSGESVAGLLLQPDASGIASTAQAKRSRRIRVLVSRLRHGPPTAAAPSSAAARTQDGDGRLAPHRPRRGPNDDYLVAGAASGAFSPPSAFL